jgi:hypothetical protein
MKILKSESSISQDLLTKFINDNNITREDIIAITCNGEPGMREYTVFFYGDPNIKQKIPSMWG